MIIGTAIHSGGIVQPAAVPAVAIREPRGSHIEIIFRIIGCLKDRQPILATGTGRRTGVAVDGTGAVIHPREGLEFPVVAAVLIDGTDQNSIDDIIGGCGADLDVVIAAIGP